VAITIAVIMGLAAFVVDYGVLWFARAQAQNAADAAALAGASTLAEEHASRSFRDDQVFSAITMLAQQNDVDVGRTRQLRGAYLDQSGSVLGAIGETPQFGDASVAVEVQLSGEISTVLSGLIGPASIPVAASARAGLASAPFPSKVVNPVALAVPLAAFQAGAGFDLYDQSVAFMSYGIAPYRPFLNLVSPANSGPGYQPAADFGDVATNLQFWSDGLHPSGQLGIGATVTVASDEYQEPIRAGLLDNVRRQGLVDASGAPYALVDVPLWNQYLPGGEGGTDTITIAGFARFKIAQDEITSTTLRGSFVPFAVQNPAPGAPAGVGWGPIRIALLR
jgi:hypothetical protein